QALAWLMADRDTWHRRVLDGNPRDRADAAAALRHWRRDADLAGVRHPWSLLRLPDEERRGGQKLWADVDALRPDLALESYGLGVALYDQGKPEEAVAAYRKAIELKPDYAPAYFNLGTALYDLKRPGEAVAAHRKAIELKPDYPEAYNNLGVALINLKKL